MNQLFFMPTAGRKQRIACGDLNVTICLPSGGDEEGPSWQASGIFYEHLAAMDVQELDFLDVGCGFGLAGLIVGVRGARSVRFTDRSVEMVHAALQAAHDNGLPSFAGDGLDWSDALVPDSSLPTADRMIGNDVLYRPEACAELAELAARVLRPGGIAILGGCDRGLWDTLAEALSSRGFTCERTDSKAWTSRRGTGVVERAIVDDADDGEAESDDDGCEDEGGSLDPAVLLVATKPLHQM